MLQIIGWLLCVYLIVKGFELVAMKHWAAYVGAAIAFISAPLFFYMINEQATAGDSPFQQLGAGDRSETKVEAEPSAPVMVNRTPITDAKKRNLSPPDKNGCVKELAEDVGGHC